MCVLFFSVCFVYFVVLPGVISFFTHFESSRLFELTLEAKISDYLELVLQCLFWVSLVFQTPVAIFLSVYLRFKAVSSRFCSFHRSRFRPSLFSHLFVAFSLSHTGHSTADWRRAHRHSASASDSAHDIAQ